MVGRQVLKLWLFGGHSNNAADCGLAAAYSNNAWSVSNSIVSARLTTLCKKTIRVSVLRHGKTPEYLEPRQRVRMYSTCLVGTTFTLRSVRSAVLPVVLVSQKWI